MCISLCEFTFVCEEQVVPNTKGEIIPRLNSPRQTRTMFDISAEELEYFSDSRTISLMGNLYQHLSLAQLMGYTGDTVFGSVYFVCYLHINK